MQRREYRITLAMLEAGALALEHCRTEQNHTPRTVALAVFTAMLDASDVHPGNNLAQAFVVSPHDSKPNSASHRDSPLPPAAHYLPKFGTFAWHGWNPADRFHYFRDTQSDFWARMPADAWKHPKFKIESRRILPMYVERAIKKGLLPPVKK